MPSPGSTILHVVFAGRGDAFYLEYTHVDATGQQQHMLVPLDGGPTRVAANRVFKGPYFKYYLAAGKHIWQQNFQDSDNTLPFAPTAIINSHPHDDHLDGLVSLMLTQLQNGGMQLPGPFVLPNQRCSGLKQVKDMAQVLGFQSSLGCSVQDSIGIKFYHPSPDAANKKMLSFLPPANNGNSLLQAQTMLLADRPVIALPKQVTVDTSSENLASILMETDDTKTVGQGRMFFTGDSVGHEIWNYVAGQHFSIYKIQHHGSLRNAQFYEYMETVDESVGQEGALYALMAYAYDNDPQALFVNPGPDAQGNIGLFIQYCFGTATNEIPLEYYKVLKARHLQYLELCVEGQGTGMRRVQTLPWNPELPLFMNKSPTVVWTAIVNNIKLQKPTASGGETYSGLFYDWPVPLEKRTRQIDVRPWTSALLSVPTFQNNFKALLLCGSIWKFFMSFTADAYVISANETHSHPSSATIAGLALAVHVRKPAQPVPLYITDGYSIDIEDAFTYIKEFGFDAQEVFSGKYLVIQCLTGGVYMSINGNGGNVANRDILGVTATLSVDADVANALEEAHTQFNSSNELIQNRTIALSTNARCQIVSSVQQAYLTIDQTTKLISLVGTAPTSPFVLYNSVQLGAVNFDQLQVAQMYSLPLGADLRFANPQYTNGTSSYEVGYQNAAGAWVRSYINTSSGQPVHAQVAWEDALPANGTEIFFSFDQVAPAPATLMSMESIEVPKSISMKDASAVAPSTTLSDFYVAADMKMPAQVTASQALQALVGLTNFTALGLGTDDENILQLQVDATSPVAFTDNGLDMQVSLATLTLVQDKTVTAASMTLTWSTSKDISLVISVTEGSTPVSTTKTLSAATALPVNLEKALTSMGVDSGALAKLSAANIVGYLVADPVGLFKLLSDRMPATLLMAGLFDLKPDLELSTVQASYDPTGMAMVKRAQIVCLTASTTWNSLLSLDGIDVELGEVGFMLEDTLLPSQSITMYGSAAFKAQGSEAIELLLSCDLNMKGQVEVTFAVSSTDSLDTLSGVLGSGTLTTATVPFCAAPLSSLAQTSELALTFTQSSKRTKDYMLSRISANTSFDDWKSFLPSEFPINNLVSVTNVRVSLDILNPLLPSQRTVGASVALELQTVADKVTQTVSLGFAAHPLGSFGDYDYRLSARAPGSGLSITDIASGMGIEGVADAMTAAGSLVSQLLEDVHIRSFSVGIEETDKVYSFTDWNLEVSVDQLDIIEDVLSISDVAVDLHYIGGRLTGDLTGTIQVESIVLECKLRLPTESIPGLIAINSPNGVSAADIASALDLSSLDSVPVLGSVLSTQLNTAHYTVGYIPTPGQEGTSSLSCLGYSFTFELDEMAFTDSITVEGLAVAIGYHSANDPYGPGKEQLVFSLKAAFNDSLVAQITYDSLVSEIQFTLTTPDPTKPAKISDLVSQLLGSSFQYALEPLIGDIAIQGATLTLSTAQDVQLEHFLVELVDQADAQFQGLPMSALRLEFTAAKAAQGSVPAVPETLVLHASIQKDTVGVQLKIACIAADATNPTQVSFSFKPTGLTIADLNDLFGTSTPSYQSPDGCPDFTTVAMKSLKGRMSLKTESTTGSSSLALDTFETIFETTTAIDILQSPEITLESLSLRVQYNNSTTSGQVFGHLVIETADIWAFFSKSSSGSEVFTGKLTLGDQQTPVPFDKLAANFLPSPDDYAIADVLGAPSKIPLLEFDVSLIAGQSIEVSGTGQATFSPQASGYTLSMSSVGGRVTRTQSSGTAVYNAFLIGELEFSNWSCVEVLISIGSGPTVLTAALATSSTTVDLSDITKSLSTDGSDVTSVSPSGTADMSFGNSAFLSINFDSTLSQIFFFGQLASPSSVYGMVLGQWVPSGTASDRQYLVSVATQDLSQIWSDLDATVLSNFDFTVAGAQILSWEDNVGSLCQALSGFEAAAKSADVTVTDVSSPLQTLPQNTQVPSGGAIFATIDLNGSSPISQGLSSSYETTMGQPKLTFYALMAPETPTTSDKSEFMVSLQSLYLLGGDLLFNGTATYTPGNQSFTANGSMTLNLSAASSVTLQMTLDVSGTETTFQLLDKPSDNDTLTNPFEDMFNVQLNDIDLSGTISKPNGQSQATTSYTLSGSVYLGTGGLRSDLTGSISFDQGKAVLASLNLVAGQAGLSISDVFSDIIQPGDSTSGSWPSGYGDLTLDSACIYYATQKFQQGTQTYLPGYHISADIDIFGEPFSITADLGDRTGIAIAGQMTDPLNLEFLQLTNELPNPAPAPPPTTTGPSLTINTTSGQTIYEVDAGVQLFDIPSINATLKYQAGSFSGSLKYQGTFLGVSDPDVTVTYADGHFSLSGWKMLQDMQSQIDLAQQICNASEKDTSCCKKLVDLAFDKTVNTKFHFSLGNASMQNGTLVFEVTWTYDISVVIPGDTLNLPDIPLPNMSIQVPPPYNLDNLGGTLEEFILKNAEATGAALLQPANAAKFAELIGAMAAESWSKETIARLICRKADPSNVEEQGESEAKDDQDDMNSPDNPGNKSIGASDDTTSSTDLGSALDSLSDAIDAATAFGTFISGVLDFLGKLLNAFTGNSTVSGYQSDAEAQKAKVAAKLKAAQDFMGSVLNLSTASPGPPSNFVSSDETGCEVEVDWSAYLPDTSGFNYDNFNNVVWEIKIGLVDDATDASMHDLTSTSTAFTIFYSDPSFAFVSTVYTYIRARATSTDGQVFYSANWTRAQPATHTPWLHPVASVGLQVSTSDPCSCSVTAPNCPAGSYRVEVVSDAISPAKLYQADVSLASAGTLSSTIGIFDFKVPASCVMLCIGRVKAVSTDPTTSHDSTYTDSQILPLAAAPTNLQAVYSQPSVTVSWDQAGTGTDDFDVFVIKADGTVDTTVVATPETAPDGQRQASLTGPSIVQGATLTIAARAKPVSGILSLFAVLTYDIPSLPIPEIDPATYYDMDGQQLHLVFTYPIQSFSPLPVLVNLTTPSTTTEVADSPPTYVGTTGTIVLNVSLDVARQAPSITIASVDTSLSETGAFSEPWQFPTIPQSLPACAPSASFTSAGSVQVAWSWATIPEATAQQVTLIVAGQQTPNPITTMVQRPITVATFTMDQVNNLFTPGQSVTIQCTSFAVGLSGDSTTITYSIPGSGSCTPFSLNTTNTITSNCTMTSLSPGSTNSMQVWWGGTNGAVETVYLPNGSWLDEKAQQWQQFAGPSTVPDTGSCMACTSRDPSQQEVWWITETGAIDGQYWYNDGQGWRSPGTGGGGPYPFNKPGQASTNMGGSVKSLSRGDSGMDMWWVDPTGAIGNARWNGSSGWGNVFNAAPAGTAGFDPSISQLTAQSLDGITVDLFCVAPDGSIVGASSNESNAPGPYTLCNIASTGNAQVGGGLTSIYMSSQQLALFWTTPQANVEMAILTKDSTAASGWDMQQQSLTEAGSTLGGTAIAACLTGTSQFSVWWIGQCSDLRRIDVDLSKAATKWPVFEELGPGSCGQVRSLIAQRVSSTQIEVLSARSYKAAQWKFLKDLVARSDGSLDGLPFPPDIIVNGHDWSFAATMREGHKTILWGDKSFGGYGECLGRV